MNSPIIKKSKTSKTIKKNKNKITFDLGKGLKKEKSSYSNIFKEKLKYVSTDIGLSQNKNGSYSNLYKDGIKMNTEDFDNKSCASLKNSTILSQSERFMTAGNSPNKKYIYSPLKTSPFKKKNPIIVSPFKKGKKGTNNDFNLVKCENGEEYFKSFNSRKKNSNDDDNKNKDKNSFRKSNKNKKSVKSPSKNKNNKTFNDEIVKSINGLINNDIKEVDEEDEKDNQLGNKLYNLINIDEDDSKKNSQKQLNSNKSNKKNMLLKNNNSYEGFSKKNKYFDLNISEIEKYLKKSNSCQFSYNYKDFETIKELLGYDKSIKNINKKDLNKNISNDNEYKKSDKTKIKTIFSKGKNINNITNVLVKSIKNNSNSIFNNKKNSNEEQNNINDSNSNKNSLECQKRNCQSYILRKGKKIIKSENSSINVDSVNSDDNTQLKKSIEETNEEINNLIKKIRESSKDKNDILINYKQQHEKELEKLMKEKSDLKMKKFKLFQEKAHKNQNKKPKNENESFRKDWKKLLINLPTQNTLQNSNQKEKKHNNLKLSKARSDLSILSEPMNSNKEFIFNKKEKKYFSFRKISESKKDSKSSFNKSNSINNNNDKLGKNESLIIHGYDNKNNSVDKNTYLEIVKEDMKNLKLNKLSNNILYKPRRKINSKNYIMPVNNLNDVIKIKDAYYNINVNKIVNKKK